MEYLVENKRVRYNPYNMKKDRYLGEGMEGTVFEIDGYAIKFYKPICNKIRLNKEEVLFLSNIKTKRILTPLKEKILLNKRRELMGYGTEYIEDLGLDNLLELPSDSLKEELQIIKDDVSILSNNSVLVSDFCLLNLSFNNGIYVIDPGSFTPSKTLDPLNAYTLNIQEVNEFLILALLSEIVYYLTNSRMKSRKIKKKILYDYYEKQKYPDLIEYLTDDIKSENLKDYVMVKTL